jgi:peptide/nickel transport system substrate-binding protein
MSYAVKYKTNKGEEEMKKRRVAKLIVLSMVAATLLTGVNVQAKEEKVVTAMTSIDLTPELCDPIKSGPDFRLYEMIYDHWCVMEKMEKLNRHWQNLGISVKMAQPIRFI